MATIALVEDHRDTAELIRFTIADGNSVHMFGDGESFLQALPEHDFDLVLLDLELPGISGYEVFSRIQEVSSWIPVVAISAHAAEERQQDALALGFQGYFTKPFYDLGVFRKQVLRHLRSHNRQMTKT